MLKIDIIKKELKTLVDLHGVLTPQMVLKEATKLSSPLHNIFEWDDTKAAESYRVFQARQIISSVSVEIEKRTVRAYENINVTVNDKSVRAYVPIEHILTEEELYHQVIEEVVRQAEALKQKVETYQELKDLINVKKLNELKLKVQ